MRTARFGSLCFGLLTVLTLVPGWGMEITREGVSNATVVVAESADPAVKDAVAVLLACVKEASGADLSTAATRPGEGNAICVGRIPGLPPPIPDQTGLDDDGFDITFPDERTILILGPTPWGTEFGIYDFLERYVGVRWLLPGDDGTDVPAQPTIVATGEATRRQPAFISRLFSGLRGGSQAVWARRNRMHGRVSFHHNLITLFPPESYTKTHPEFFPVRNGERYLPATNSTHGWQPCFSAPGIVEEAVKNICAYFAGNPGATSYSLGTNDSSGYCACDACVKQINGEDNFLGRKDYSDLYYDWCNRVIDAVLKEYPDKVFGCLAYSEVAAPPAKVKVHPRLIPYMTYDRMKWTHTDLRLTGEETTRAWHRTSPTLGWYDYIYGTPYVLPRVWFHHMADYYRFGHANGVRALYAEAYPNWGEGPKLYISLKLQWDPNADVDALLSEWYERCVGPGAAPFLAKYYGHWEEFWTQRILDSAWFTEGGQYLNFSNPSYLADVDPGEIEQSRTWLEAALAAAVTPKQKARATLLLRAFEYYEATFLAYTGGNPESIGELQDEADALRVIAGAEGTLAYCEKRRQLLAEFATHPVLVHPLPIERFPLISGGGWSAGSIWAVYDLVSRDKGPVRERIEALAQGDGEVALQAQAMLQLLGGQGTPMLKNTSFEEGDGAVAEGWTWWVKWGTGRMLRSDQEARTGTYSVLCEGMKRGGPVQAVPITPGRYGLVCFVYIPQGQACRGAAELAMTLRNGDKNLPSPSVQITPVAGRWTAMAVAHEVPEKIGNQPVTHVLPILIPGGLGPEDRMYFDDLILFRLE